jgi:methylphosphotriester-DNA--protein-cysteine methyltransferase
MMDTVKTREQIATEYKISPRTLRRWLKKAKICLPKGLVDATHQRLIYETFGCPNELNKDLT